MEKQIRVLFEMGTTPLIMGKRDTFESIVGSTSSQMIMAGVEKHTVLRFEVINTADLEGGVPKFYLDQRTDVDMAQTPESFYRYLFPTTKTGRNEVPKNYKVQRLKYS